MSEFTEDDANQEQRIDWLKDRGVEIEFPADRKEKSKLNKNPVRPVKVVKIPCNGFDPYEEIEVPVELGKSGDLLINSLKSYFAGGSIEMKLLKEAASKQFASDSINISSNTVDKMADMGSVELFPLTQPIDANTKCRVGLYLDEAGQLKGLTPNVRATALAAACGFENVPLVGDMYVGRCGLDEKGQLKNLDFTVSELGSDAQWLKDVKRLNYEHGLKTNRVAMDSDLAALDISDGKDEARGLRWNESDELIEVGVTVPGESTAKLTSKEIKVKFTAQSVTVQHTAGGKTTTVLHIPRLAGTVRPDECTWSISGLREVELSMEKAVQGSRGMWRKLEEI